MASPYQTRAHNGLLTRTNSRARILLVILSMQSMAFAQETNDELPSSQTEDAYNLSLDANETTRNATDYDERDGESLQWFGIHRAPIDDNLITDRPDFTESTEAIPIGRFQLELGYTFTYDREDDVRVRDHTAPELLLRMGIVEDFELRFAWAGYSYTETRDTVRNDAGRRVSSESWEQGANDFELGFKLKIAEQNGLRPNLAILGAMTFPTGSSHISPGDVEPLVGLLWAYDLSDDVALAGQFLVGTPVEDGRRYVQSAASLSLGVSLTERLGTYIEYYGIYHNTRESDCAHTVNGGFTYLITNNLQFDIRAGFGLNEEADDFFTGAGLSWRF